jgi:hypothetical protein
MRPVSFTGLHRILHLITEYPDGINANLLNEEINTRRLYLTRRGSLPSLSTLYHCRNTLLRLKTLLKINHKFYINLKNSEVKTLIDHPAIKDSELTENVRNIFASLVIQNKDCKELFFNLFMHKDDYCDQELRTRGNPVIWKRVSPEKGYSIVILESISNDRKLTLNTASKIKSILYGVRYWARDELNLIDEFFHEGKGSIMFPILNFEGEITVLKVVKDILSLVNNDDEEWTTLSLLKIAHYCCIEKRRPLTILFKAIARLFSEHSGYVVLIPTSRSFATITARSRQREQLELRRYFRDTKGRYISHIRIHKSVKEAF